MGAARRGLHERTHNFRCGIPSSTRSCGPKGQCPRRSPGPTAGLDRPRTASCCAYAVTEICRPCTVHLAQWRCRCSLRVWPSHQRGQAGQQRPPEHKLMHAISTSLFSCNVWDRRRNRTRTRTLVQNFTKSVGGHRHAPQPAHTSFRRYSSSRSRWLAGGREEREAGRDKREASARSRTEAGGRRGLTRMTGPPRDDAEAKQPPPPTRPREATRTNEADEGPSFEVAPCTARR
jgi:hypothetical protein